MSAITPTHNAFIPAQQIYAKVLRDFKSFQPTNAINQGEFPEWTVEFIRSIGTYAMKEEEALLKVRDYKAVLPDDYHDFYAAYKCHARGNGREIIYQQNQFSAWNDLEISIFQKDKGCEIDCCHKNTEVLEYIKLRQYVGTGALDFEFHNPILLRLAPHSILMDHRGEDHGDLSPADRQFGNDDCPGAGHRHRRFTEISIDQGFVYTHFKQDCIYLQYYAIPLDADGLPMIPNDQAFRSALEWWIKYQLTLNWWFNNEVPDIKGKWDKAEEQYLKWYSEAEYIAKLPSFQQMINSTRNARTYNKVSYFSNSDWKRY